MIDVSSETVLPLAQSADELPRRRGGKKTNTSTIYRWSTSGCRGVILETIQVGATRCTSREALQGFFESLTSARGTPRPSPTGPASVAARDRRSEAAGKKLEAAGA